MQHYGIVGASVAIIKNYHVVWSKGFGYRNKSKNLRVNKNTVFNIASISKPVSAVATLIAFQNKSLSLDKNINDYLSSWKIPNNHFTKNDPVTMRLLLSHTAGITGARCKGYKLGARLPSILQALNGQYPANTPPVSLVRKPNTQWEYSPLGYLVVQKALQDIYNKPFPDIMDTLILKPLQMKRSKFSIALPKEFKNNVALPYLPNGKIMPNAPLRFVAQAAGSMWSTADDLAKFLIAIQLGNAGKGSLITSSLTKKLLQPSKIYINYGAGMDVNWNQNGAPVKHGSYFGHTGWNSGYLGYMLGSETTGNGIVILLNTAPYMTYKGSVVQYKFMTDLIAHVAQEQHWKN